jgi:hypothetical protein
MKRSALVVVLAAVVSVGILAACVGDDPATSSPETADGATTGDTGVQPDASSPAADGGDAGASDGPQGDADAGVPTFCQAKPKPVGVDDYLCADFDNGPLDAGFTGTFLTAMGTLESTSAAAASAPNALLANMSPSDMALQQRGGALEWTTTGAAQIKTVSITVKINPDLAPGAYAPSAGTIELVGLEIPSVANISLRYQDAKAVNGDLPANYVGYYLHNELYAGAVGHHVIAPAFANAVWTTMKLDLNFTTNKGTLSQNGVVILNNVSVATQPASNLTFDVGYRRRNGTVARPAPHRFDDVIVEVTRQ